MSGRIENSSEGCAEARIMVNGEAMEVEKGLSVSQLLAKLGIQSRAIAVEINAEVLSINAFENRVIQAGDSLEIVTLVGGG